MLLMMDKHPRENCRFLFLDTDNEDQAVYDHRDHLAQELGIAIDTRKADFTDEIARKRRYVEEKWPGKGVPDDIVQRAIKALVPTGNAFLDLCIWKGRFPSRMAQFCTQELKARPANAYMLDLMSAGNSVESWRGIRRDESQNRKNAQAEEWAAEGWKIVHPIVDWTAQQTVDFVLSRGIKLNPLYSLGASRVGCMPCINENKDGLLNIAMRKPEHIDRIEEWERLVADASKRGFATFFATATDGSETDAEIAHKGSIRQRVEWAKTSHGGKAYDLERFMPPPSCSSVYGLCE